MKEQILIYIVGKANVLPSEAEGQSLAGSTAGLIRNEQRHRNGANGNGPPRGPGSDAGSLHFLDLTRAQRPNSSRPVMAGEHSIDAPIISLPYQVLVCCCL